MKSFIISIVPFVSMAVRTFSANAPKLPGIKLLTSKKISLLLIVTFLLTFKAFSQTAGDGLVKIDSCFLAGKMDPKTKGISISKTFCVGDKITVKLRDNKIIRGKISKLSKNYIVTSDDYEIDVSKIKWIQKSKLTAGRAIVGALMTIAGLALITVAPDAGSIRETGILSLTGIVLVPTGIGILVSREKFRPEKGDKLIFKDYN